MDAVKVFDMFVRTTAERIPMSREDFLRRAEIREECLQDWEEGTAVRLTPAHGRHGYFIDELYVHLRGAVPGGKVRTEVFIDFATRTFGADIAVLFADNAGRYVDGRIQGAPDIVVEVLSTDSEERDRTDKFDAYFAEGVPWYWIGDPVNGILEEYRYSPAGYIRTASGNQAHPFEPRAIAGLSVPMSDLLE